MLPATPTLVTPIGGTQVATDTPTFTVRNAKGFDAGSATYGFRVTSSSGRLEVARTSVPAGRGTTSVTFASPLPRGMTLSWSVTAQAAAATVSSESTTFRTVSVACPGSNDPYAKTVVDWFVPACSLAQNIYNDPLEALGPPDAGGTQASGLFGFISLGERGYVTVDMETCASDGPGPDIRVYQAVSNEPVTLYASGSPNGPFLLVEERKRCGLRLDRIRGFCDFDLALGEVPVARYFKVEDGEHYPCPGDTVSEGADFDAIQILTLDPNR
jgi:hypothetical protein